MRIPSLVFTAVLAVANASGAPAEGAVHWAFRPPQRPALPPARGQRAGQANPIDSFIKARLGHENLQLAPEAGRATLLRRLSLDLLGLPPSPEDLDAFLGDTRLDAYQQLVERLLASPHYGERWGRWWLDAARYADSNGYSIDAPRSIWKYRDWVIAALNRDLPFDEFTIWQLAGDLVETNRLPPGVSALEPLIATGFHRNTQINQEGGIDPEQFRVEGVVDRVSTTATVFLGITLACAQCHDHKFDPFTQEDFYRVFAFFNSTVEDGHGESSPGGVLELSEELPGSADEDREKNPKPKPITTLVMRELSQPRATHLLIKGDFTRPGAIVTPGVPRTLSSLSSTSILSRLDLARWIASSNNPLTARVLVNRVWQQLFGRGLVETENDFGTQGSPPSHPELLDWLACEFMAPSANSSPPPGGIAPRPWSLKHLHRLIVTSDTYRQSSRAREELLELDPGNRLLARQSRLRLDAELLRDVGLAASGLLAPKIGGPPVFPPQPEGVMTLGQSRRAWKASSGSDRYRRGIYTFFWRATPHPALAVFDAPDAFSACTRRLRSNTPLQALTLLNDEQFYEFAQGLARRLLDTKVKDDSARIDYGFRLCTGRHPNRAEQRSLEEFLRDERKPVSPADPSVEQEAWVGVCRVLLNLDETITRE